MDLATVEKVMQLMRNYGVHAVEIKEGDREIKVTQTSAPSAYLPGALPSHGFAPAMPLPAPTEPGAGEVRGGSGAAAPKSSRREKSEDLSEIRSPFVGTYYSAPSPGADDFIHVGKRVKKGETLCIVEAMKLMNEIEAERDGVIVEILAENEEPVEYDQVLFLME